MAAAAPLPTGPSGQAIAAWGQNFRGQLGNGTSGSTALVPVLATLPAGTRITQVAPGCDHSLALTSTGSVLAWGDNSDGELGNGTTGHPNGTPAPVLLPHGTRVTAVTAGENDSLAVTTTGRVLGWGDESFGSLGNGRANGVTAVPVRTLLRPGLRVRSIFAGCFHTLAVTSDGSVLAWGDNGNGQLGNGSQLSDSTFPVHVPLPNFGRAVAVGGGCVHSVALTSRGQLLAWGASGLLGNGSQTFSPVPVPVKLPAGRIAISTGGGAVSNFSLALLRP
jgi:alpha-tubulin suppressor-like RCC1 family protein